MRLVRQRIIPAVLVSFVVLAPASGAFGDTEDESDELMCQPTDGERQDANDVSTAVSRSLGPTDGEAGYAAAVNGFAFDLLGTLPSDENLVYSPYGVYESLGLLHLGARGETAEELDELLRGHADAYSHRFAGRIAAELKERASNEGQSSKSKSDEIGRGEDGMGIKGLRVGKDSPKEEEDELDLRVANDLWLDEDFEPRESFLNDAKRYYSANPTSLDLSQREEAARQINGQVEKVTEGQISDLISPSMLHSNARLVQTNAVFFKATWKHTFDDGATDNQVFTLANGEETTVPMMHQERQFKYTESEHLAAKVVELPYKGGPVNALVVLPTSGSLQGLESRLDDNALATVIDELDHASVDLKLPKFELRDRLSMKERLKALGLEHQYEPWGADFEGITQDDGTPLYVSEEIHSSIIEVDETTTRAGSAFGRVYGLGSADMDIEEVEFYADRPFLFLIVDEPTETVLFVARVMDPNKR